jgi:hypothetical protein
VSREVRCGAVRCGMVRCDGTRLTLLRSGPACWLWDYLRRSRTQGYFLPLSGGIDSCATATIVHSMCRLVAQAAEAGGESLRSPRRGFGHRISSPL